MKTQFQAQDVANEMKKRGLALEIIGDPTARFIGIGAIETAKEGDLVFVDKKEYFALINEKKPSIVITSKNLATMIDGVKGITFMIAPNVALAHAWIKQHYADRDFAKAGWSDRIHPSSVIHETCEIASTAIIEPRVVIGAGVKIGENSRIMAGVVIEHDVVIGARTILHPSCVIGYSCRIGNDVVIGSGTVVGSEGYGFAQDSSRKSFPIPQTGIVVIEDRVRLGANCCIDRATYRETRIGSGTKLDNLCHIAHNVEIGQDCLLTSMLCVAGSTKIGNRVMSSGQTGIADHVSVCDDAVLLHRAGVTKDIEKPGAYAGLPTQPLSDYMKNSAVMRNAVELRKRISDLEEKLAAKN